jgi:hypothetical protein
MIYDFRFPIYDFGLPRTGEKVRARLQIAPEGQTEFSPGCKPGVTNRCRMHPGRGAGNVALRSSAPSGAHTIRWKDPGLKPGANFRSPLRGDFQLPIRNPR